MVDPRLGYWLRVEPALSRADQHLSAAAQPASGLGNLDSVSRGVSSVPRLGRTGGPRDLQGQGSAQGEVTVDLCPLRTKTLTSAVSSFKGRVRLGFDM